MDSPVILGLTAAVLSASALLVGVIPARRAASIDTTLALGTE